MAGGHAFGEDYVEDGEHAFAFFDGDVGDLGDFGLKDVFSIIDDNGVFEHGHVFFCPVGKVAHPEFFIGKG